MPRLLRASEYRVMLWKNGGGTTSEILIEPPSADMANFDWRISMARIDQDGDFSRFPGVDRTLTVLSGSMDLHQADGRCQHLNASCLPYSFPGERAIAAEVQMGPIHDLNVFTRRAAFAHHVWRHLGAEPLPPRRESAIRLIAATTEANTPFAEGDCLVFEQGEPFIVPRAMADNVYVIIDIWRA
jgi:environmental stress-induced protein Ves